MIIPKNVNWHYVWIVSTLLVFIFVLSVCSESIFKTYVLFALSPPPLEEENVNITVGSKNNFSLVGSSDLNQSGISTYENDVLGIRLKYPTDWKVYDSSGDQTSIKFCMGEVNVAIAVLPSPCLAFSGNTLNESVSLDQLVKKTIRDLNSYPYDITFDIKIINSSETVLSGKPAHLLVYTQENLPRVYTHTPFNKVMKIITINDSFGMTVSFMGFEEDYTDYFPIVRKVIDSIEFSTRS